jgi:hypothetical protein
VPLEIKSSNIKTSLSQNKIQTIAPNETIEVPFTINPKDLSITNSKIEFFVNGKQVLSKDLTLDNPVVLYIVFVAILVFILLWFLSIKIKKHRI